MNNSNYLIQFFRTFDDPKNSFYFMNSGYRIGYQDYYYNGGSQHTLDDAYTGLIKTNQSFLHHNCDYFKNCFYKTEALSDDPGIFYIVPKISQLLDITLLNSYFLVSFAIILFSFIISLKGIFLLFKNSTSGSLMDFT